MARKPWWPHSLAEQLAIMVNTLAKIAGHQVALGLSSTQVDRIEMLCNTYIAVYNWIEATRETAGEPYIFQLRVQLRKNNANYGNPSSAITITVNP